MYFLRTFVAFFGMYLFNFFIYALLNNEPNAINGISSDHHSSIRPRETSNKKIMITFYQSMIFFLGLFFNLRMTMNVDIFQQGSRHALFSVAASFRWPNLNSVRSERWPRARQIPMEFGGIDFATFSYYFCAGLIGSPIQSSKICL